MGYEINGRTGWRRDVCLHAASKPPEPAGMKDRLEASAVLFHQYCDFFPLPAWFFPYEEIVSAISIAVVRVGWVGMAAS